MAAVHMIQPPNPIWSMIDRKRATADKSTFQLMLNMASVDEVLRLLNARWLEHQKPKAT